MVVEVVDTSFGIAPNVSGMVSWGIAPTTYQNSTNLIEITKL